MGKWVLVFVVAALAIVSVAGCGSKNDEFGSKKEDWSKTAPPPGWKGPGQPGGPSSGAASSAGVKAPESEAGTGGSAAPK